jgi:CHAT domain-containing protein/tetratricopeptide (TPR) repeat protein
VNEQQWRHPFDEVIIALSREVRGGRVSSKKATEFVMKPEFASALMLEGCTRLATALARIDVIHGARAALELASLMASHAEMLTQHQRWPESSVLFQATDPVYVACEQRESLALCRGNLGLALLAQSKHQEAFTVLDSALSLMREYGLCSDEAVCLRHRGLALANLGRMQEAFADLSTAMRLARDRGLGSVFCGSYRDLCNYLFMAIEHLDTSEHAPHLTDEVHRYLEWAMELAFGVPFDLQDNGEFTGALALWDIASSLAQEWHVRIVHAYCEFYRASILRELGQRRPAIEIYRAVLPVLASYDPGAAATCHMNLGNALNDGSEGAKDLQEAIAEYDVALPVYRQAGRDRSVGLCQLNRGNALARLERNDEAIAAYHEALGLFRSLELHVHTANCLTALGGILSKVGRVETAEEVLRQVDTTVLTPDWRGMFYNNLAGVARDIPSRREESLANYESALVANLEATRTGGVDEWSLDCLERRQDIVHGCTTLALDLGMPERAFSAVQQGKGVLFAERGGESSRVDDNGVARLDEARRRLVDCLDKPMSEDLEVHTDSYFRAFRIASLMRCKEEAGEDERTVLAALPEIQAALPSSWAVIDLWLIDSNRLAVFLLTNRDFEFREMSFPLVSTAINGRIERFLSSIATLRPDTWDDSVLDDIERYLFSPLRPWLTEKAVRGIYLVPDGTLHLLPLHAARREVDGRVTYLCDEFDIGYLPSSCALPRLPSILRDGPVISFANPERGTTRTLPWSEWESSRLRAAIPEGAYYCGLDARLDKTYTWGNASLVHFSCHGVGDAQCSARSHVRLADDVLLAHDVAYRRPPLRKGAVVVLNGCQTGRLDVRAVNEGMGLASAFLRRQAGLVLATQWSVVDPCAATIVLSFVSGFRLKGLTPAESLRLGIRHAKQLTFDDIRDRVAEARDTAIDSLRHSRHAWEVARQLGQAALLGDWVGDSDTVVRFGGQSGRLWREVGDHEEATRMESLVSRHKAPQNQNASPSSHFANPMFWAAFRLIGRIT